MAKSNQNQNQNSKGGLLRDAAISAAVTIASKAAAKWRIQSGLVGCTEDARSGALMGVVLAWDSWKPEFGGWEAHAYRYAEEYAKREIEKYRSVVQTNYMRRTKDQRSTVNDDSLTVWSKAADNAGADIDVDAHQPSMLDTVAARETLDTLKDRFNAIAATLGGAEKAMAPAIVARLMAGEDGESLADIATRYGYTRQSAYRAEVKLREALTSMTVED